MKPPIAEKVLRLRQRRRADGTWRVWWEPRDKQRALGFQDVDLDADRPTWSVREAKRLNADVARAEKGTPRGAGAGGRTMSELIHLYRQSRKYQDKSDSTRRSYDLNLRLIEEKWGPRNAGYFTKAVMHAWYETLYDNAGKHQAVSLIRTCSILFSHAELIGWRPDNSNPCYRLGMKQPKGRARIATWAELDALMAAADTLALPSMALAIGLSMLQGQRQTDVRLARAQDFRQVTLPAADGRDQATVWIWEWTRSKRQNAGVAPVHAELVPRLEAAIAAHKVEYPELLLDARTGRPLSLDLFQKRFAEIRAHAAKAMPSVADLQFRDLRRTFGNMARAGGATKDDTADVLGNSAATNAQLGEVYMATQLATARRAIDAVQRPEKRKQA